MVKGDKSFPKDGTTNEPDESKIMELLCSSGKCKDSDMEISLDSGLVSGGGNDLKTNTYLRIIQSFIYFFFFFFSFKEIFY